MAHTPDSDSHLEAHVLASLAEGRLARPLRPDAEHHIAACPECREELYAVRAALQEGAAKRPIRTGWVAAGVAAAAVAAVVLVSTIPQGAPSAVPSLERASRDSRSQSLTAHLPAPGSTVRRSNLRFVWAGSGPGSRYEITVVDSLGDDVWHAETSDTFVVPPTRASIAEGALVYWYVDALLPDGRIVTSRSIPLRVQR